MEWGEQKELDSKQVGGCQRPGGAQEGGLEAEDEGGRGSPATEEVGPCQMRVERQHRRWGQPDPQALPGMNWTRERRGK